MRDIVKWILPHGLVEQRQRAFAVKREDQRRHSQAAVRRTGAVHGTVPYSYDAALEYLISIGLGRQQILAGSMPLASLEYGATRIEAELQAAASIRPLLALHVGNYVGMSLAYFCNVARSLNAKSWVVSIDPNFPHRNVQAPMNYVLRLLSHFGMSGNNSILTGCSLEKNLSNDGAVFGEYDPAKNFGQEITLDHQLDALALSSPAQFDFVVMDGNHAGNYLTREIQRVDVLLRHGGLLVLDDVSASWKEIQDVYQTIDPSRYDKLGADERIGVLRKRL